MLQELDMQRIGDDVETGKSNPSTDTEDTPKLAGSTSQRLLISVRYQDCDHILEERETPREKNI